MDAIGLTLHHGNTMKVSLFTVAPSGAWIAATWASVVDQGCDFEWIIGLRAGVNSGSLPTDPRIKAVQLADRHGAGDAKRRLIAASTGDVVTDLALGATLAEGALKKILATFADPAVGFAAGEVAVDGGGPIPTPVAALTAWALSHVGTIPRGLPSWRRVFYSALGGHEPSLGDASDYDLMCRTYLKTVCRLVAEPVCIAARQVDDALVSSQSDSDLARLCGDGVDASLPSAGQPVTLRDRYLHELVAREADLRTLPRYDIGGGIFGAPGWKTLDVSGAPDIQWDVFGQRRLPFEDNSVGAFRAFDFLEHGEDMDAFWFMDEVHRCLAPGGWFLSYTPHALGIGASCDPSHRSRWDERRFLYWCSEGLRPFLLSAYPKATAKFHAGRLFVERRLMGPAPWRFDVPYLVADIMKA